ncbi:uncharacterized protein LODBEIA_P46170 [Lodderomyces beijingensis]|uniref:Mitochondrial inner membrane i-AAA protease complex subunit MGR1 n=1 Tax=Lodderomyces beijingensis TaxID=1775926 RepID=A0ABP0ZQG2_9ASCO
MGYIPPPDDREDNSKKRDRAKPPSPNSTRPISASTDSESTTITIVNPLTMIPHNPSFGLIWGPLTPASDNGPALYTMISLQFIIGVQFFRYARRTMIASRSALPSLPHPPSPPRFAPRPPRSATFKSILAAGVGATLIFGSGLELARLAMPYDPWFDEARHYRKVARKNGDVPNFWFGAYRYFEPMSLRSWHEKVSRWFESVAKEQKSSGNAHKDGKESVLPVFLKRGKYQEVHESMKRRCDERAKELLSGELEAVNELNKAQRLDLILEGKSPLVNSHFNKASIQLGQHSLESDDDFEMVWLNFEPWDELRLDTDLDIRVIPRYSAVETDGGGGDAPETEAQLDDSEPQDSAF